MLRELSQSKTLILGAGVTGVSLGRALQRRGAQITLVDEHVHSLEGFTILSSGDVDVERFDFVVTSPGWRPDHPILNAVRAAKKPLLNEIDIAWWIRSEIAPGQKWLALTGTNGKTSTVELTAAALREGGLRAIACGNVGNTVIDALESGEGYDYLVLELSSFQLHWMSEPSFIAAAILNVALDHIDWHGSFENYTHDKVAILNRASTAILNGDDPVIVDATQSWNGRKVFFTLQTPAPGELGVVEDLLVDRAFVADPQEASLLCELAQVQPRAPHSVANALAAAGLARAAGVSHEAIARAIAAFSPGRHRIEVVAERDGVRWIDDSKATNPHAARASLAANPRNIWIAGGLAKGATFDELISQVHSQIKAAIIIGQDGHLIQSSLAQCAPHIPVFTIAEPPHFHKGPDSHALMLEVVKKAAALSLSGDTVLLAPACASMDQFESYADRGDCFAAAVKEVLG